MADAGQVMHRAENTSAKPGGDLIDGRYAVRLDAPLAHLDTTGGKAYRVADSTGKPADLYAILHHPNVPHRQDVVRSLMRGPVSGMLNPVAQEIVRPAQDHPERLVTLVEMPPGPPLIAPETASGGGPHFIRDAVLPYLLDGLKALSEQGIPHRAIRPDNIFFASEARESVVLGQCFSSPPGADQPACLETLGRMTAHPHGRGAGNRADDMFALGGTLMCVFLGMLPTDEDIDSLLQARLARGSFWTLSKGREVPGILGTLLRGLLNDDLAERWQTEEVRQWLDGGTPSRRAITRMWTFSRPVTFRRKTYSDRRLLAHDLAAHPLEGAPFLRGLEYPKWAQNMMTSEVFSERVQRVLAVRPESDTSRSRHGDHALVARVAAHLDPLGPVRFRGTRIAVDGVGPAMAHGLTSGETSAPKYFADLFSSGVLPSVVEIASEANPAARSAAPTLVDAAKLAAGTTMSTGVLRVLYMLNPSLPCQSPHLGEKWISDPVALLRSLDARAAKRPELSALLDEHALAFFADRVDGADILIDRIGGAGKDPVHMIGTVANLLAYLQSHLAAGPLPNLTDLIARHMQPLVKSLKSKTRREGLQKRLEKLGRDGNLEALAGRANLVEIRSRDQREYRAAQERVRRLETEIRALNRPVKATDPVAQNGGYKAAGAIGWLILMTTLVVQVLAG